MLDTTSNHPSKYRTEDWVEINDDSHETDITNSQIKFKVSILKSGLCDNSDTHILFNGYIRAPYTVATAQTKTNKNKKVIFKKLPNFTDWMSKINNTQVDLAKGIEIVMPMFNLIENSDNYFKINSAKNSEIMLPLKYLSNFWRTLKYN